MRSHTHLLLLFLFLSTSIFAQRRGEPRQIADKLASGSFEDAKFFAYGVTTNTNSGILGGFVLRHSNVINVREGKTIHRYAALEVVNIKNSKESNINLLGSRRVQFKENYFFAIRPEYGREWFLFRKNGDEGVGLSGILAAGPTIGIEKPYYIRYAGPNQDRPSVVPYDPDIHNENSIVGAASFWQGFLKGAKVVPGVHVKSALNLDMNTFGDNVTGFEFGFTADYFFRKPVILSTQFAENKQFYTAAYVTLYFGNKRIKK